MTRPSLLLIALLLTAGPAASAEPLGRLFFSPAERAALDQARAHQPGSLSAATHGEISLSGYVRRSSGKTTTWINSVPQHDAAASPTTSGVPIRLPSGRQITLKPGQSYDQVRGEIREGYQGVPVIPPVEPQGK